MTTRISTKLAKSVIENNEALNVYTILKELSWVDGIPSKKGKTRKAYSMNETDIMFPLVNDLIHRTSKVLGIDQSKYYTAGIYLNFYKNGEMWTPNHSHPGTKQLIISLGATRNLVIGKKIYQMSNGDAIVFGSSIHGVPKQLDVTDGRISIAVFLQPNKY